MAVLIALESGRVLNAQQLPAGTYQPNRERSYDLIHLAAELRIDWSTKAIAGEAILRIRTLGPMSKFSLDAYRMTILGVRELPSGTPVTYSASDWALEVNLGRTLQVTDTVTLAIRYSTEPTAGLYFVTEHDGAHATPSVFTYGEGGINANWLPLYAAPNDKFTSEMTVTVEKPYAALSNGRLLMADYTVQELIRNHEKAFKPEAAEGVEAVIQYHLTGEEGGDWIIDISGGRCTVSEGNAENPMMSLTADAREFADVLTGEANGMQYFMQGKIRLSGDLNLAMKLTSMFTMS